jgi:hypothetical protein
MNPDTVYTYIVWDKELSETTEKQLLLGQGFAHSRAVRLQREEKFQTGPKTTGIKPLPGLQFS